MTTLLRSFAAMPSRSVTPPPGSLTADRRFWIVVIGNVPHAILDQVRSLGEAVVAPNWDVLPGRADIFIATAESLNGASLLPDMGARPGIFLSGDSGANSEAAAFFENALWLTLPVTEKELAIAIQGQRRVAELQNALAREETRTALSQRRLGMALKAARMGTWTRDLKTRKVEWSPELEAIYGLEPGTFPGTEQAFLDLMHPNDRERVTETIAKAMRRREDYETEFRYLHASGEYRWMVGRGRGFYDRAGNLIELAGVGIDITEKKRAEQNLFERELQLRRIGDNLPDGALYQVVANTAGERSFIYWSAGLEKLTGVSVREALRDSNSIYGLIHPDDAARVMEDEERSYRERHVFDSVLRLRHRTTGEWRWVHLRSAPRILPDGSIIWDGIYFDISQAKEAERALREADRRKNEFLAMLSHELRNPLAAIRNALEVCDAENWDDETFQWTRGVLLRQSSQLARLVDDLLDVARITRGKIRLRIARIDAAAVLDRAIESVQSLITERQQELIVDYDKSGTLQLDADPARLEQIVVNLLTNANKYSESGGRIFLKAWRSASALMISVRDTGIGIQPEKLPEMFEIFTQGERSMDRSEGGLGLGLTIVRSFTELHGGTVSAFSEGLGKGTEFTITLPSAPVALTAEAHAPPPALSTPVSGNNVRVLVVDDNTDTAHGLARLLRRRQYNVEVAHDGHTALESAKKFVPVILLLDLGLPVMNGFELASHLRAEEQFRNSLMIAISGYGQDEDRIRSKAAGFDYHLTKPVDLHELETLLAQSVNRP